MAEPGRHAGERATREAAAQKEIAEMLDGRDGWSSLDPNRLNKSLGESVLLYSGETRVRVTPVRAVTGTAARQVRW